MLKELVTLISAIESVMIFAIESVVIFAVESVVISATKSVIVLDKKLSHHNGPINKGILEERRYSFVYTIYLSVQSLAQLSGELNTGFNGLLELCPCASS